MRPNRREFLLGAGGLALALLSFPEGLGNVIHLKAGAVHTVSSGEWLTFPSAPKRGDRIALTIGARSLRPPAQILYLDTPLLGEREHLLLDSLANIHFFFGGQKAGWHLFPPGASLP